MTRISSFFLLLFSLSCFFAVGCGGEKPDAPNSDLQIEENLEEDLEAQQGMSAGAPTPDDDVPDGEAP